MSDAPAKKRLLVALAGQQNSGKSTLFNALTGVHQHIANYPGVTVDKKSGSYVDKDLRVEIVDLPGTYSLTSFSLEERVVRQFLIEERPDVVVNVLDASNIRRGLYLRLTASAVGKSSGTSTWVTRPVAAHSAPRRYVTMKPTQRICSGA